MRTSPTQFNMLVEFMERYGDLDIPIGDQEKNARKRRLEIANKWNILVDTLNKVKCGDRKSLEKWKKVWKCLKYNTKRKAVKIQQAASKTQIDSIECGETSLLTLTNIEKRVLNLMKRNKSLVPNIDAVHTELTVATSNSESTSLCTTPALDEVQKVKTVKVQSVKGEGERQSDDDYVKVSDDSDLEYVEEPSSPSQHATAGPSPALQRLEYVEIPSSPSQHANVGPSPALPRRRMLRGHPIRQRAQHTQRQSHARTFFTARDERRRTESSKITPNTKLRDREFDLQNRELDFRDRELELRDRELKLRERELVQNAQNQAQWQMLFAECIVCFDKYLNKK